VPDLFELYRYTPILFFSPFIIMEATNVYGIKKSMSQQASEFVNSNDMVTNVVFILILLVVGVLLFNYIISLVLYFKYPSNSPHLIDGMVDTKDAEMKITQNPHDSSAKTILISENEDKGLEFSWSFWIYLEDLDYRRGELKNVFVKGDNLYQAQKDEDGVPVEIDDINNIINSPGVYLTPYDNKMMFVFNTYDKVIEKFEVDNIPMKKWVNVIIKCENKTIDIFMNTAFVKRYKLSSLPRQNYNNVYIGKNKGFAGYVSNLWYFNYGLGTREIGNIYRDGANTELLNKKPATLTNQFGEKGILGSFKMNFLSFRWFFQ